MQHITLSPLVADHIDLSFMNLCQIFSLDFIMATSIASASQTAKRISHFNSALSLYTVDFPIYFIESISERHIVIAGGGGSSKTGVYNQINVLELVPTQGSCSAEIVMKYQTPDEIPDAIMTGALMRDRPIVETHFVSGGSNVTIYSFKYDMGKNTFFVSDYVTIKDSKIRAELKTVKYTPGRILAGSIDGQLTSWVVTEDCRFRLDQEVEAHSKEIDDIDVDTVNQVIVTLSRSEGRFITWNLRTFKQISEVSSKSLTKKNGPTSSVNYIFRACRYAYDTTSSSNKPTDVCLLVACNPTSPKNQSAKLYKWQLAKDDGLKLVETGQPGARDNIMAMAVGLDGKYVGVGTRSGGVSVLEVKNLRNIYTIEGAHHNAITDVEFLPPKQESLTLTNSNSCPLLSVSIDRRVVLHRPRTQAMSMRLIKTFFMLLVIYLLVFILHNHYDVTSCLRSK